MAENVLQTIEVPVPLELFGSLVTEMNPSDLPEGISPDNQDVVYLPGGVSARSCMRRWLSGLTPGTTITYQKTFVTPAGLPLNLILTSDGDFWVQNTQVPPYTPTHLGEVVPGSYASSVTAFGKELIVFHNNQNGTDIPRTYDGQYFDRATQCGPGAPPTVSNVIIPPSTLAASSAPTEGVAMVELEGYVSGVFTAAVVQFSGPPPAGFSVGISFSIAGNTSGVVNTIEFTIQILSGAYCYCSCYSLSAGMGTGGTATVSSGGSTLVRNNNLVTANTTSAHGLQKGFQAQITGMIDTAVGGGISSLVIDNENTPGVATITTNAPHGLLPQCLVNLLGINGVAVGGAIVSASRSAEIVTIQTFSAHGLSFGALVTVAGLSDNTYNGQFIVLSVPSAVTYTYEQVDTDSTTSGSGTTTLNWIPNTPGLLENYYTVISAPTTTSFQVQVSYTDGTWTSGTVTFSWNGIFYVTSVITSTQFTYQQYGPNSFTTTIGTVTPYSQISPGVHQCVLLFQTRQGFIPAPSPVIQFVANGGQYLSVSNIPLGPSNIIARYLAFTGAQGDNFFYIPVPAFVGGITISTSTGILDNVTTTVLLDFSDNTLFDSLAIDIPGNNLFEMAVIGPCLGVDSYASRASWWGWNNSIPNLLNLGFEGGYYSGILTTPLGWTVVTTGGILDTVNADFGMDWLITGTGSGGADGQISQSAYQDGYGIAILQPLEAYTVNLRLGLVASTGGTGGNLVIDFYSPTMGVLASAIVPISTIKATPNFYTANFSAPTPATIPIDTLIRVYLHDAGNGTEVSVDEILPYPTLVPTVPNFIFSYVNFPESLDQETGIL